jgi:hypothetical protein
LVSLVSDRDRKGEKKMNWIVKNEDKREKVKDLEQEMRKGVSKKMKARIFCEYTSVHGPNDHIVFHLESIDAEPYPLDYIKFESAGGKALVRGSWRDVNDAEAVAREIFKRDHPDVTIQ